MLRDYVRASSAYEAEPVEPIKTDQSSVSVAFPLAVTLPEASAVYA